MMLRKEYLLDWWNCDQTQKYPCPPKSAKWLNINFRGQEMVSNASKWGFERGYLYWKMVSEFSRAENGKDVLMGVVGAVLV